MLHWILFVLTLLQAAYTPHARALVRLTDGQTSLVAANANQDTASEAVEELTAVEDFGWLAGETVLQAGKKLLWYKLAHPWELFNDVSRGLLCKGHKKHTNSKNSKNKSKGKANKKAPKSKSKASSKSKKSASSKTGKKQANKAKNKPKKKSDKKAANKKSNKSKSKDSIKKKAKSKPNKNNQTNKKKNPPPKKAPPVKSRKQPPPATKKPLPPAKKNPSASPKSPTASPKSSQASGSGFDRHGELTFYGGAGGGGACTSTWVPSGFTTVALNGPEYGGGEMCGACLEACYTDSRGRHCFKAIVDNKCPECKTGDLDLGESGDGRWELQWKRIKCPARNNVLITTQGSNPWYAKVKAQGGPSGVKAMTCDGLQGQLVPDAYFVFQSGSGEFACGMNCKIEFEIGGTTNAKVTPDLLGNACNY